MHMHMLWAACMPPAARPVYDLHDLLIITSLRHRWPNMRPSPSRLRLARLE
jgi:hypothetical protein